MHASWEPKFVDCLRGVAQPGDIIGFSGSSWLSAGICIASYGVPWWSLSHVGILGEYRGDLLLFESTTLDDMACVIQGKCFKGTQAVEPCERVARYEGRVWHYPLSRTLYKHERRRLSTFLVQNIGVPYDQIGAFRAGGEGFSWLESHLRNEDLSSFFCSEYVIKAHAETGLISTDNASRWSPNRAVRFERKHGILRYPVRCKSKTH